MTHLSVGDQAPAFSAPDDSGQTISSDNYKGKPFVLYFYPKDDTPGCTAEACTFTENIAAFNKIGVAVLGVSRDSVAKHKKFKDKYGLKFPLLADEDGSICEAYGTWVEKSMYGRKYMGIDRATFAINSQGAIAALWTKVKVPGHIEDVLKTVQSL